MHRFHANIQINTTLSANWCILGFEWPKDLPLPLPGQFFTYRPRTREGVDAGLLRRPLAFAGISNSLAFAIYQIRGPGTRTLGALEKGESIDIIAPLGNTFPLPVPGMIPVLLGGGIGIGPMLYLQSFLSRPSLFLGFRSMDVIPDFGTDPALQEFASSLKSAAIATDDGSSGFKGTVLDLATKQLGIDKLSSNHSQIYACGPAPMLAAVDSFSRDNSCVAYLSVEQWMACGVGACHGCVLPASAGGYVRACADGPVFKDGTIQWEGAQHG